MRSLIDSALKPTLCKPRLSTKKFKQLNTKEKDEPNNIKCIKRISKEMGKN